MSAKLLCAVLLLAVALCGPIWAQSAPVELGPGVTLQVDLKPWIGAREQTVSRTYTVRNMNQDVIVLTIELGALGQLINPGTDLRRASGIYTAEGYSGVRRSHLIIPVPAPYVTFVPGELYFNDKRQPDPVITNDTYDAYFDVPAATAAGPGVFVLRDRVDVFIPEIVQVEGLLHTALLTTGEGKHLMHNIVSRTERHPQLANFYWWTGTRSGYSNARIFAWPASKTRCITETIGGDGAYARPNGDMVRDTPGSWDGEKIAWDIGDVSPFGWGWVYFSVWRN